MNERLQKALDFANFKLTLHNQKQNIVNTINDKLIFYENKGKFTADKKMIAYVNAIASNFPRDKSIVLLDDNNNPIKILNLKKFLKDMVELHKKTMEEFYIEYEKLSKSRNIKKLLNLEENGE